MSQQQTAPSPAQQLEQRRQYWSVQAVAAARAVEAWHRRQWLDFEDAAGRVVRTCELLLYRARTVIKSAEWRSVADLDARVAPLIEGVYRQVQEDVPRWTDPVVATVRDVKDAAVETATQAATWGAAGSGAALVLLGAAYLYTQKRG